MIWQSHVHTNSYGITKIDGLVQNCCIFIVNADIAVLHYDIKVVKSLLCGLSLNYFGKQQSFCRSTEVQSFIQIVYIHIWLRCYTKYSASYCSDVILRAMASQITSLTYVYSGRLFRRGYKKVKAPRQWHLCGKCFYLMASSCPPDLCVRFILYQWDQYNRH